MDKDLQDAVRAAFDGKPADEKPAAAPTPAAAAPAEATPADEEATPVTKSAGVTKKPALGAGGATRRLSTVAAAAARKGAPARAPAEETAAAPVVPRQPVAAVQAPVAVGGVPRTPAVALLALLVSLMSLVLLVVVLGQIRGLSAAVGRQDDALKNQQAALKELRNLARVTVSVYQEPGKRPQQVIAGHDVDAEGKVKIGKMIIQPLPEE
jgi:hypothetical protein